MKSLTRTPIGNQLAKMKEKACSTCVLTILAIIILTGCSATGPKFNPANFSSDNALIYLFRPSKLMGSGNVFTVYANTRPVTILKNGGYFPYEVTPGKYDFKALPQIFGPAVIGRIIDRELMKNKVLLSLSVQANRTYYVRLRQGFGLKLEEVPETEALPSLDSLRLAKDLAEEPQQ